MRTKLSFKLTSVMVKVALLVMVLSLISLALFLYLDFKYIVSDKIASPFFKEVEYLNPMTLVKNYGKHMNINGDIFELKETGKRILDEKEAWLQLLDEDGEEVFSYNTGEEVLKSYTPYDLALIYESSNPDSVYIDELEHNGRRYSIILGFKTDRFRNYSIYIDIPHFKRMLISFIIIGFLICLLLAFVIGSYYSMKLTLPIQSIINRIELLSNNIYHHEATKDPFYSDIYDNLNKLSSDLQEAEMERKELEKLKSDWISNISHDIKTPLASIRGYSEILKDYDLSDEETKEYGDILHEKSLYIEELLGELRLSDRLKDKEISLNMDKTNLVEFSRAIIVEALNTECESVNINFETNKEEIYKEIDQFMFRRVYENLIYNSIYYSKEEIKIDISLEETEDEIILKFRDNGIGIKEEDLNNIFNRYYRGSNTSKKGTGLGLAITKDIVERHGGSIQVDSIVGEFTEFVIKFKVKEN